MTPEALRRLSTLLDQALDLDEEAREAWLTALPKDSAELEPMLRKLLARQASNETHDLLERPLRFDVRADTGSGTTAFQPDDTVGPYRLLRSLGHGGMGEVWQAERADGTLKRKVALKLPHVSWAPGLAERFAREREILASLEHPNIARLYDAGFDPQGRPYMALEFVEGLPIDEFCKRRALPVDGRLRLLLQVADAVAFAHSRLVIHRDLKPGNILVTEDGHVRLLDFGIAKLMEGNATEETALTRIGGRALTLDYASPEQIRGEPIGTASDVYSLGVVAFELLAGARPYRLKRQSAAALEEAIMSAEVPLASAMADEAALRKKLAGDLDAILNKALKKDAADRYPTVDALAQDWRRHLEGHAVSARPDTLVYRLNRLLLRHRVPVAAAAITVAAFALALGAGATALVIFALLIGLGAALWQARAAAKARDRALALASRNEAALEFLNTLVTQAARTGKPLTPEELLKRSEALVERELKADPEHHATVLAMMGMSAQSLGNPTEAVRLLRRALDMARDSTDQDLQDMLVSQHAFAIGWSGRYDEAKPALEAIVARRSTPAERRAEVHHYLANLAGQRQDGAAAVPHALQALRWLRASRRRSPKLEASMLASLGYAYELIGRSEEADRQFAAAIGTYEALGQEASPNAIALLNNRAVVNERRGDVRQAFALCERALSATTRDAPDTPKSPYLVINRARALDGMGRWTEAEAGYVEGVQLARAIAQPLVIGNALCGLASVRIDLGRIDEAAALLAEVDATPGSMVSGDGPQAHTRLMLAGRLAVLGGEYDGARKAFTSVIGEGRPTTTAVMAWLGLADANRLAGRLDVALVNAQHALEAAQSLQRSSPFSFRIGLAALMLARLHDERGDAAATTALAQQALEQLINSVDGRHPALDAARRLAHVASAAAAVTTHSGATPSS